MSTTDANLGQARRFRLCVHTRLARLQDGGAIWATSLLTFSDLDGSASGHRALRLVGLELLESAGLTFGPHHCRMFLGRRHGF